jgi:ribosomal protein S16
MVQKGLSASEQNNGITGSRGSSVKGILFVLFALAVCFGYFYFFTDVLRSKEETPGQPDVYSSEVRKPLPERLEQFSSTSVEEAVSPPPAASSLPESPSSESVVATPQVSPGEVPVGQIKPKPVPAAGKPAAPPAAAKSGVAAGGKNSEKPKHGDAKSASLSGAAKSSSRKGPAAGKETKAPDSVQKTAAKKIAKIPVKSSAPKETTQKQHSDTTKAGGRYTLVVGNYVLKSTLGADKVEVEKSGLQTYVQPGTKKSEPMNRLLVAEVSSSQAAQEELAKLKKASKDAFFLRENGKYVIYSGSYFAHDRAAQEQERLRKLGFVPILKKTMVPVSTYSLTAGRFPTREAALKGAERLKKIGFNPYPAELPK